MRVYRCLLICAIVCAQVKYSFSQTAQVFGICVTDADCPDNSECITPTGTTSQNCRCLEGFEAIDETFTSAGRAVTVCVDLGPCNPYDNVENDCGTNGECVSYIDEYGTRRAICRCQLGFYGPNCNLQRPSTTTGPTFRTTRKPGNIGAIIPVIGGGAALLLLLAVGGAALASSAG